MTKAVSGAKRGRPPKPKGRRAVPLREHPSRYIIAIFDAMSDLFGGERNGARVIVTSERLGRTSSIISKNLHYPLPEAITAEFERAAEKVRLTAYRHARPDDMKWRKPMMRSIGYTLAAAAAGKDWREARPMIERTIIGHADAAGEAAWARQVLLPLLKREPLTIEEVVQLVSGQQPPDLSCNLEERILEIILDFWLLRPWE